MSRLQGESIGSAMERAFNKILPIPKIPKNYGPPPPRKPMSWVPRGRLGDPTYERMLEGFASKILEINASRTNPIKCSSRGWCYLLEGLGLIHKGEFNSVQKAINDCRKIGLLPINFVAEDQDETRRFRGVIEASDPAALLAEIKGEVLRFLGDLPSRTTDYWEGEEYYLMMCVEKGDILTLFEPICREYHVPIVSSKGWPPILLRAYIALLSQRAEAAGLTPVLLLFYDHDPAGIKISETFRKMLKDCERGTGWSPDRLIIDRFGLNKSDIDRYNLTWIENLRTSSGRESHDREYIAKYGKRKCESNALFKNDATLRAGEEICRRAIEKYYGPDARERFRRKERHSRRRLRGVYDNPAWKEFLAEIDELAKSLSTVKPGKRAGKPAAEEEVEVAVDGRHYGTCPRCGNPFDYGDEDIGRLVRCRACLLPMRLRVHSRG